MTATIYDIANRMGLSKSTVAACLGGAPGYSAETRERVNKFARRAGYRPSYLSKALAGGKTHTIAIVCDSPSPLTMGYVWAIEQECFRAGYQPFVLYAQLAPDGYSGGAAEELLSRQVDGVIVYTHEPVGGHLLKVLRGAKVPVVYLRSAPRGAAVVLQSKRHNALRALARHLRDLGHESVTALWFDAPARICDAYRAAFEEENVPLRTDGVWAYHVEGENSVHAYLDSVYQLVRSRIAAGDVPTAIVTIDDEIAMAAIAAIHDAGLSVPGDISVAGKDGTPVVAFTRPSLTTIQEPGPEAGIAAFEVLHQLMDGKRPEAAVPNFEAELVVRQSTGPRRK